MSHAQDAVEIVAGLVGGHLAGFLIEDVNERIEYLPILIAEIEKNVVPQAIEKLKEMGFEVTRNEPVEPEPGVVPSR